MCCTCTPGDRMVELYSYFNFFLSPHFCQPFTWWRLFLIYSSFLLLLDSPLTHDPDRYSYQHLQFALSIYIDRSLSVVLIQSTVLWGWLFQLIVMLFLYIDAPFNSRYDCYVKMEVILIMNIKVPYLEKFKYFKIKYFSCSKKLPRNSQRKILNFPSESLLLKQSHQGIIHDMLG